MSMSPGISTRRPLPRMTVAPGPASVIGVAETRAMTLPLTST